MKAIQGMFPPIVTAFKANGDIDDKLVAAEMDFALRAGVQGLSVAGSTFATRNCATWSSWPGNARATSAP